MDELKKLLEALYIVCDNIQALSEEEPEISARDALKYELMYFAIYMAGADSNVSRKELKELSALFDIDITDEEIRAAFEDPDIRKLGIDKKVPEMLKVFAEADTILTYANVDIEKEASRCLVDIYRLIGQHAAQADGLVSDTEVAFFNEFIDRMDEYVDEKLNSDMTVQAPSKAVADADKDHEDDGREVVYSVKAPEKGR